MEPKVFLDTGLCTHTSGYVTIESNEALRLITRCNARKQNRRHMSTHAAAVFIYGMLAQPCAQKRD